MSDSFPHEEELGDFIDNFLTKNAAENGGHVTASVRQVRAALAEHFDVEDSRLKEEKSQFIKTACQDAVSKIEAAAAKPDSSESSGESPPKSPEESELDDTEPEDASRAKPTKKRSSSGSTSATSSKPKKKRKGSEGKPSDSKRSADADDEVTRLKKFVTACGVRKQWKNWFASQDPAAETPSQQAKALRSLLAELGMEGRLSMEKAKKIKEKREFEEEMRAIGADVPPESDDEDGKSRGRRAKNAGRNKAVESTSGDEDGDEDDDEDDQPAPPKKTKFSASLAAFAAELNSDDE